jgi:hypothetical protein
LKENAGNKSEKKKDKKAEKEEKGGTKVAPKGKKGKDVFAIFETNKGTFKAKLFPDKAPKTVENFIGLAEGSKKWTDPATGKAMEKKPLYDGTIFHRVIPKFMIQGGEDIQRASLAGCESANGQPRQSSCGGGKIAITDIEVVGSENIIRAKPDTLCLFIIPPSFEEWQKRLKHRGRLELSEYNRRLKSAAKEFKVALSKDHNWIIVNDKLDDTVSYIERLSMRNTPTSEERQAKNRKVLEELLEKTEEYLSTL